MKDYSSNVEVGGGLLDNMKGNRPRTGRLNLLAKARGGFEARPRYVMVLPRLGDSSP